MRWTVASLVVSLLAAALAGCSGYPCTPGPLVSARSVPPDAPAQAGEGLVELRVHVKDPSGSGIPDAGVVVYWGALKSSEARGYADREGLGEDGAVVEPGTTAGTPVAAYSEHARTGSSGVATVLVPRDRVVGIVAAKDGWTEEWIAHLAIHASDAARTATLPLYPLWLEWRFEGNWSPAAVSVPFTRPDAWVPQELPGTGPGQMARAMALTVAVAWNNTPTSMGMLAAAAGYAQEAWRSGGYEQPAPGPNARTLALARDELREAGFTTQAVLEAGPAARPAVAAPLGLPYTVHATLASDRLAADTVNCLYVTPDGSAATKYEEGNGDVAEPEQFPSATPDGPSASPEPSRGPTSTAAPRAKAQVDQPIEAKAPAKPVSTLGAREHNAWVGPGLVTMAAMALGTVVAVAVVAARRLR